MQLCCHLGVVKLKLITSRADFLGPIEGNPPSPGQGSLGVAVKALAPCRGKSLTDVHSGAHSRQVPSLRLRAREILSHLGISSL